MTINSSSAATEIPVGYIDDPGSMDTVFAALRMLHGPSYDFALRRWHGMIAFGSTPGQVRHFFVVKADKTCQVFSSLAGLPNPLWPGDLFCIAPGDEPIRVEGDGVALEVITETSGYPAPRLVHLRDLADKPGGCAAYPGAFRRESLPPVRPPADAEDRRGVNRINEHTLDMRYDRTPPPIRHCHGPVAIGEGRSVDHSETAIVLPRSVYGLPPVNGDSHNSEEGHVIIYTCPLEDPTAQVRVPVRPGSVIVTPAGSRQVMGHAFENAFAMLVAIPGFVAPYHMLDS